VDWTVEVHSSLLVVDEDQDIQGSLVVVVVDTLDNLVVVVVDIQHSLDYILAEVVAIDLVDLDHTLVVVVVAIDPVDLDHNVVAAQSQFVQVAAVEVDHHNSIFCTGNSNQSIVPFDIGN